MDDFRARRRHQPVVDADFLNCGSDVDSRRLAFGNKGGRAEIEGFMSDRLFCFRIDDRLGWAEDLPLLRIALESAYIGPPTGPI